MRGVVFRGLEELAIETIGMQEWDELLETYAPQGRVYVSPTAYPDEELFALAQGVASKLDKPLTEVLAIFGQSLFGFLAKKHVGISSKFSSFEELVVSIDSVIHMEVKKLYDEPNLPSITTTIENDKTIILKYKSNRKLCFCAEGLLHGAAQHYNRVLRIEHPQCMHEGADHCVLILHLD
ncbi:heme NO-binding domain-containing protein [Pseudoalteromonas sp. McH1-7]|uniref:4-vinyl reductase 4VR domain-containing protein n=1 Tax=Pseudoalteromonas peptidolytica F12-50-A1 TaxID=1315280 RepID=A0A8I0MWI9_9GAMM|nr:MULTISPECIES: heme NO-binding domain-containing protein [Pseudoalteromonas]MBE0346678.1 hypothetical protein [Pseudoalteromonas peptidolytica F12-50-A1]MDW7549861.1 heme NO-binding domain-containing protein [Pseudoalteromonas peptidolytica]NLR13594.1 hypothetical protein [Pseudoalteromonas peptidolytica]NUZ09401.1 heme NO-binding domain-containing protein [Pseudoalteromonas sp. McH1-7]RRS06652.1 hypothetical protein EAG18_21235 [Pseudoalteromonas sp. J010]